MKSIRQLQYQMKHYYSVVKKGNRNVRGLVTSYQAKMANSIVNKTMKTDKSTRQGTEHTQRTQQMDEYQDLFEDIEDSIFIDFEEQRKIQQILQFARKGKINQSNAFDIPMKVIDPQFVRNNNLRFWKFASQLLSASIHIYDKRVQNMFHSTNKVFEHLVHAKNNEEPEINPEETYYIKSRRKKEELMKMQIAQMSTSKEIKFYQIGQLNRQAAQKINIRMGLQQFNKSPVFLKALKAFDSNQLKNLFLNVFEPGNTLQIAFFHDKDHCFLAKCEKLQQIKESFQQQESFPLFVQQQLHKISCHQPIFNHITHMAQAFSQIQSQRSCYINFENDFSCFKFKQLTFDKANEQTELNQCSNTSSFEKFSFNFVTNQDIGKCLSQQLNQSMANRFQHFQYSSQRLSRQFLWIEQNDHSIMMPQELQFRGLRLKKKPKIVIKQKKNNQKSKQSLQLQFLQIEQNRNDVLKKIEPRQQIETVNRNYADKFVLGKTMDPFIKVQRIRGKMRRGAQTLASEKKKGTLNVVNQDQTIFKQSVHPLQNNPSNNNSMVSNNSLNSVQEIGLNISTEGLNNLKAFGLRSIRQIKQSLYNRLEINKQLRLSEVDIEISPNSIFLIFLHLVNQNQLQMGSIEDEKDAILYFRQ